MGKHGYTDEQLEMLSDEEREGLLDDDLLDDPDEDGSDEDAAAATSGADQAAAAADEGADDAAGAEEEEAAKAGQEDAAGAAAKEGADVDKAKAEPDVAAPAPVQATALPIWEAPADAEQRLQEIDAKKDELYQKFDDGELTAVEHRQALKELDREERQIRDAVFKADFSLTAQKQAYVTVTVPTFLKDHPEYEPGSAFFAALDVEVRRLQAESSNPFDPALLEKAHEKVRGDALRALGIDPATVKTGKDVAKKAAAPERVIPPTLGKVPSADLTEPGVVSKFAALDRLDGEAYEKALAKLTDAERDQYLQEG